MDRRAPTLWILPVLLGGVLACKGPPPTAPRVVAMEPNAVFWGDTHVHTSLSPDAYALGNHTAGPDTAYRWAKGSPVVHPQTNAKVQIQTPLDFLIAADQIGMQKEAWERATAAAERHYEPCRFTSFIGWEWAGKPAGRGPGSHRIHEGRASNRRWGSFLTARRTARRPRTFGLGSKRRA